MEIVVDGPIFIGFKTSRALRQMLESLGDVQKAYVASDDSGFLKSIQIGEDLYVGRFIREAVSTDRVDDIRRNILSILRKLGPVVPLPTSMRIYSCRSEDGPDAASDAAALSTVADPSLTPAIR